MTDQEINVAIAVARGWKNVLEEDGWWNVRPDGKRFPSFQNSDHGMPDCCNDLNAMRDACLSALDTDELRTTFARHLDSLVSAETPSFDLCDFAATLRATLRAMRLCVYRHANAPARQRAEAFLRTLGKWID